MRIYFFIATLKGIYKQIIIAKE